MSDLLFTSANLGKLTIPNRLVRSATAERMCDGNGFPKPALFEYYRTLARGGVGLLITGHAYVHPSGKAHPEMMGIYSNDLITPLRELVDTVHKEGGLIAVQINHGGMQCEKVAVEETIAPSVIDELSEKHSAREITLGEITMLIEAYGEAARRAKQAGFDAIQIHAAHGFLMSEFLSPYTNRRRDDWGGSPEKRLRFLRQIVKRIREQVGMDYPLFIKLAAAEGVEGGLSEADSKYNFSALAEMGLDALEISGGMGGASEFNARFDIIQPYQEAYFRPFARLARQHTHLPILLVGGNRSRAVMEDILSSGDADFISLCRPLICEADLPNRFRGGQQESKCISANLCWANGPNEGIACKCPL